jgi:hypothetical protein
VKSGWKCPGYATRWKFVDENLPLSAQYRKKKYVFEDVDGPQCPDQATTRNLLAKGKLIGFDIISTIGLSLSNPCQQTCLSLCYLLDDQRSQATLPLNAHGSFYGMLPARLGHSDTLDIAVSCLCSLYADALRHGIGPSDHSFRLYGLSLQSLRKDLTISHTRTTPETISASIILQLCEMSMNDKGGQWNRLCEGTRLLIQECDLERFKLPFERAMLESQRAWFIVQDASLGRECFLSRPDWRNMLHSTRSILDDGPTSISLRAQLCDYLVDVLGLLREASNLIEETSNSRSQRTEIADWRDSLMWRTSSLKQAFEWWYDNNISTLRRIYDDAHPEGEKAAGNNKSVNEDLLLAVIECVSNSLLIRLDMVLSDLSAELTLGKLGYHQHRNVIARRQTAVLKALEYVREHSRTAAKPLEFGLQVLWLEAGFEMNEQGNVFQPVFRGITPVEGT